MTLAEPPRIPASRRDVYRGQELHRHPMNDLSTSIACAVCGHGVAVEPSTAGGDAPCRRCGHLVWFRVQSFQDPIVVDLLPNLSLETADISFMAQRLIIPGTKPRIILNLSSLRLAGSRVIGRLIALQQKARAANGTLVLCGLHPVIRETLNVMRIEHWFDFGDQAEGEEPRMQLA